MSRPHKYEKDVTELFYSNDIKCPRCLDEGTDQNLHSEGDREHIVFCPHCDLVFELKLLIE